MINTVNKGKQIFVFSIFDSIILKIYSLYLERYRYIVSVLNFFKLCV
jgi:hypothetical protein